MYLETSGNALTGSKGRIESPVHAGMVTLATASLTCCLHLFDCLTSRPKTGTTYVLVISFLFCVSTFAWLLCACL